LFSIPGIHILYDSCICHLLLLKSHFGVFAIYFYWRVILVWLPSTSTEESSWYVGLYESYIPWILVFVQVLENVQLCISSVLQSVAKVLITRFFNAILWFNSMPSGLFIKWHFLIFINFYAYVNRKVTSVFFMTDV
jgi:hypothetical protein